nr:hypothetical protein [Candidatus Sigynarchaeota archaeon]
MEWIFLIIQNNLHIISKIYIIWLVIDDPRDRFDRKDAPIPRFLDIDEDVLVSNKLGISLNTKSIQNNSHDQNVSRVYLYNRY